MLTAEIQRQLFYHEADVLRLIDHPRIPKCMETFSFRGNEYMVQEYVHGDPVSSIMLRGYRFSEKEIIKLIMQLLEILCYLHSRYIVHRDLRLGNLLLNNGQLYLIDFGLARKFQCCSDWVLLPELVPSNASPAYLSLRREISPKSDIFGAGIVAIDFMRNWFPDDVSNDFAEYPISPEFRELLKKLLGRSNGFTTTHEAMKYLKKTFMNAGD